MFLFHVESICFYFMWNLYVFILCGIYMFLFHIETNAFSIAWMIQQEVFLGIQEVIPRNKSRHVW